MPIQVAGPRRESNRIPVDTQPSKSYLAMVNSLKMRQDRTKRKSKKGANSCQAIGRSGQRNGSKWAKRRSTEELISKCHPAANGEPSPCSITPRQALSGPPPKVLPVGCGMHMYVHLCTTYIAILYAFFMPYWFPKRNTTSPTRTMPSSGKI